MEGATSSRRSSQGLISITKEGPPQFSIPKESVVCIEHPCIIKNIDKGIISLGGDENITKFLDNNDKEKSIGAALRADDPLAKTMPSKQVSVNQLIIKVSAPKRTGRKRKRGSNEPFWPESSFPDSTAKSKALYGAEATSIFKALRDNPDKYKVEVIGQLKETHRFRSMPDYQYAASTNTVTTKFRDTLLTGEYDFIKRFKVDGVKGLPEGQDIGAPPFFSINRQPYNYNYRQNPYVKLATDETGATTTVNITAPARHIKIYLDVDDPVVPTAPPPELVPEEMLDPRMQEWVIRLRAELEKRPLMQRRVYTNIFKGENELELKRAAGYVGYTFSSGPFKDVLIKFGVDPRTDPKYRIYQAVAFQIPATGYSAPDDPGSYMKKRGGKREFDGGKKKWVANTHIFDGTKFYRDGKIWQMAYSGWYGNGTWSVLRITMKDMIRCISEGKTPHQSRYKKIARMFPSVVTAENVSTTNPDSSGILQRSNQTGFPVDTYTALLASQVRAMSMASDRYMKRKTGKTKPGSIANSGSAAFAVTGELMEDVVEKGGDGIEEEEEQQDDEDEELIGMVDGGEEDQDEEGSEEEDEEMGT